MKARTGKMEAEDRAGILKAYRNGLAVRAIAKSYGVSYRTVMLIVKDEPKPLPELPPLG